MPTLRVADFSIFPGGRFKRDGSFSGEEYRNDILAPALLKAIEAKEQLVVELSGTKGYGSSFLEEAFGGLIRRGLASRQDCERYLEVMASNPLYEPYRQLTNQYLAHARPDLAVA